MNTNDKHVIQFKFLYTFNIVMIYNDHNIYFIKHYTLLSTKYSISQRNPHFLSNQLVNTEKHMYEKSLNDAYLLFAIIDT